MKNYDYRKLDWPLIICYLILTFVGWISIFSAVYDEDHAQIFDITQRYGMQFIWIVTSFAIAFAVIFLVNSKLYSTLAWIIYGLSMLLLVAVIFLGIEVNGSRSWFEFGPVRFQPAEVAKIATTLALAAMMSSHQFRIKSARSILRIVAVILLPMAIIVMQKETGSALVFLAFIFMLFREGLSGWYILFGILAIMIFLITLSISPFAALIVMFALLVISRGIIMRRIFLHILFLSVSVPIMILTPRIGEIGFIAERIVLPDEAWLAVFIVPAFVYHIYSTVKHKFSGMWLATLSFIGAVLLVFSVEFFFERVLKDHQRARIENLLGINVDLKGAGYNVHQSKIAIGSGGLSGKGFLKGTQTKYNFVPEQSTDFIFCTVGEEWGFLGSTALIMVFLFMIIRIVNLAEKQKDNFNRIFGYSLASIMFMHFLINIGMTIGIMPVIGIPLPFVSYGGSSLWSFTLFLFIFIRLDLDRWK
ncbi:MAG: rod shape-determining protein RodA [Bacteroidales bacterium]|nr:rod shape-determining protein RodA [Bacteroidales bacterium]